MCIRVLQASSRQAAPTLPVAASHAHAVRTLNAGDAGVMRLARSSGAANAVCCLPGCGVASRLALLAHCTPCKGTLAAGASDVACALCSAAVVLWCLGDAMHARLLRDGSLLCAVQLHGGARYAATSLSKKLASSSSAAR